MHLLALNKKEIINYTSDYEQEKNEYYEENPYETPMRQNIVSRNAFT